MGPTCYVSTARSARRERVLKMATLSVLRSETKPIGTKSMSELLRVWDNVRRLRGGEGTEEYSVQTR
jgi:hypothetical protein